MLTRFPFPHGRAGRHRGNGRLVPRSTTTSEGRSQVLGQRTSHDSADGAVFGVSSSLQRLDELVRDNCGNLRHGSAYRLAPIGMA